MRPKTARRQHIFYSSWVNIKPIFQIFRAIFKKLKGMPDLGVDEFFKINFFKLSDHPGYAPANLTLA